jgi:hypothetical protein
MGAKADNKSLKNNTGIENGMLSMLFLAGTLGVFFIMKNPENSLQAADMYQEAFFSPEQKNAYLSISGKQEQHRPVSFNITTFNEHVRYVLDLGNGERKEVRHAQTSYIYRESGAFRVKLIALHRNEEKVIFSDMIYINPGADIADRAF